MEGNFSKATVTFAFTPSLKNFPNSYLNATSMASQGYAMERNAFRIYHSKTFDLRNEPTWDINDGFSVSVKKREKTSEERRGTTTSLARRSWL
ncbi:hypothetical protein E8E13_008486 [Curvularia kusanoi]|uniref:Uncharacterized protein n=1 Tax=Curvularia kusanoi TaxID=90978 RepID=A0A9P4TLW0_CURKU|nr:hypothetical protein E8E13_008486 [Curvularia kusanoi]